jgi:2-oxoglutarate dehydrogenase E2 component (dihydrolipoamide succinyltransferase)
MATPIAVPPLGESVTHAVLVKWLKGEGDYVRVDEPICELETDKANTELPARISGVLHRLRHEGDKLAVGEVVASIEPAPAPAAGPVAAPAPVTAAQTAAKPTAAPAAVPASPAPAKPASPTPAPVLSPAARRIVAEHQLDPAGIAPTGPGGRITKQDAQAAADAAATDRVAPAPAAPVAPSPIAELAPPAALPTVPPAPAQPPAPGDWSPDGTRREPMSRLRKRIAERLVQAQHNAAILTTFNEVDLSEVTALRQRHKEAFEKKHGVTLGFMSFFARATVLALAQIPRLNAFLEGDDIVYHRDVHLGIAVSTDRGLAVPVLRHAQSMSFARIETEIKRLAEATREGKLSLEELTGGTFSVTNGGVFGSLLSTPILNPPQSGILGMHAIQKRPVAVGDRIEIRPMMYVALSYDHRLIDGREAITFLVRLKQLLEDPARLLLDL